MASPGNRHCASCIGTLSFPIGIRQSVVGGWIGLSACCRCLRDRELLTSLKFNVIWCVFVFCCERCIVHVKVVIDWLNCAFTSRHRRRVAGEGRHFVAPPCPRSTARLQRSPVGRVESFRSWSSHLFRERPGRRRHVRSGGRLSDTLMWSWRAMFAGVSSSSRATCKIQYRDASMG